ncbi:MAG: hypothetical protein IMX00_04260 [Limnochordales bacterium]|nr:hypothetical protein [Limnochordales bacterium]
MTPTPELRARLRKLLNDPIPAGGSDADAELSDADLDLLLTESQNLYGAASAGWTMKAGLLQAQIESYSVGQERYDLTPLKDRLAHALAMAQQYANLAQVSGSSVILRLTPPEVL